MRRRRRPSSSITPNQSILAEVAVKRYQHHHQKKLTTGANKFTSQQVQVSKLSWHYDLDRGFSLELTLTFVVRLAKLWFDVVGLGRERLDGRKW